MPRKLLMIMALLLALAGSANGQATTVAGLTYTYPCQNPSDSSYPCDCDDVPLDLSLTCPPDPCLDPASISLDVSGLNGGKETSDAPLNYVFSAVATTTGASCGAIETQMTYSPASSTPDLISGSGSTTISFGSGSPSDAKAYTITIEARFTGQTAWLTLGTATFTYTDPCLTTTVTATNAGTLLTNSVYSSSSSIQTIRYYDAVSGSDAVRYCGSYTLTFSFPSGSYPLGFNEPTMRSDFRLTPSNETHNFYFFPNSPQMVGDYSIEIKACLTGYATKCSVVTQPAKITDCIPAVQVTSGSAALSQRYFVLYQTQTFNYQLEITKQHCCACTTSDWTIEAGTPKTGSEPTHFTSSFNIGLSTGLYSILPSQGQSITSNGTYTVNVKSVIVNSTDTYGPSQAYSLSGPTSFVLNVLHPCSITIVTEGSVTPASPSLAVWDAKLSIAYAEFSDTIANNSYSPNRCEKDYQVSITSTSNPSISLSTYTLTNTLQVWSENYSEIGSYTVNLTGFVKDYPSRNATKSFTLELTNPCDSTILSVPEVLPTNMTTSVLVQSTPGGAPLYITQQIGVFKDSISKDHGDSSGTQYCGARQYSVTSAVGTAQSALNLTELSIDPTGVISLYTARANTVGTHTVTVTVKLPSYTNVAAKTVTFDVKIIACIITSFAIDDLSLTDNKTYKIADPAYQWNLVTSTLTTQTPPCGYPVVFTSTEGSSLVQITPGATSISYSVQSRDLADSGEYPIVVQASLNDYVFDPPVSAPACESAFTLTLTNVCFETQVLTIPTSIENFVTFVGYNITSLANYTFNDTESEQRTLATDSIDFCDEKSLEFMLGDLETTILTALNGGNIELLPPIATQQLGVFQAQVAARMKKYPEVVSAPVTFNVTLLRSIVPEIENYNYFIGQSLLSITYDQFQVLPQDYEIGPSIVEAHILDESSKIDSNFVDLNCDCLTSISELTWITFDANQRTLEIQTQDETVQGEYTIALVQSFTNLSQIRPYSKFKLSIKKLVVARIPQRPPFFESPPPTQMLVQQNCTNQSLDQIWSFQIPEILDPSNTQVNVSVQLDEKFFDYDTKQNQINQIKVIDQSTQSNKTIKFTLKNQLNLTAIYSLKVQFACQTVQTPSNFTPQQKIFQSKTKVAKPAQILKMGRSGDIDIEFYRSVFVPNLTLSSNNTPNISTRQLSKSEVQIGLQQYINKEVLEVQLKTQFNTSDVDWLCTDLNNKTLSLWINFTDPMEISQTHQDQLILKFIKPDVFLIDTGKEYIFSNDSLKILTVDIPRQLPKSSSSVYLQSLTESVQQVGIAVIIVTLLVQIIAKKVITSMWLYYCALQLVLLQAQRSNMYPPASVDIVTGSVSGIINLSSLDKKRIAEFLHLEQLANNSVFQSLDGVAMTAIVIAIVVIVCAVAIIITRNCKKVQSLLLRIRDAIFWNFLIRYFQASFIGFNFAALTNVQKENPGISNLVTSSIILAVQYGVICTIGYVLTRKDLWLLNTPQVKKQIGNLYQNIDTRSRYKVLYGFIFFLQRFSLVILVAIKYSFGIQWQLYQIVLLLNTAYLLLCQPYSDPEQATLDLVNCGFLIGTSVMTATYSGWNTDANQRYLFGIIYNCVVVLQFLVNLVFITFQVAHSVILKLKQMQFRWKERRRKSKQQKLADSNKKAQNKDEIDDDDVSDKSRPSETTKFRNSEQNIQLQIKRQRQIQEDKIRNILELDEISEIEEESDLEIQHLRLSQQKGQLPKSIQKTQTELESSSLQALGANQLYAENDYSAKAQLARFLAVKDPKEYDLMFQRTSLQNRQAHRNRQEPKLLPYREPQLDSLPIQQSDRQFKQRIPDYGTKDFTFDLTDDNVKADHQLIKAKVKQPIIDRLLPTTLLAPSAKIQDAEIQDAAQLQAQQEQMVLALEIQSYYAEPEAEGVRRYPKDKMFNWIEHAWPYFKQFSNGSDLVNYITPQMHRVHVAEHLKREWIAIYPSKPYLPLFIRAQQYRDICKEIEPEVVRLAEERKRSLNKT